MKASRELVPPAFCLCCLGGATFATTGGWLSPRQAYAEARGLVSLIKDSAATAPITTHKLRNNISVLDGSGGNIAVLTGPDGKVLVDAGISVSRTGLTEAFAALGNQPITHLINTHWHFDHADGNDWLHCGGRQDHRPRKYPQAPLVVQRVEDWDYNFLPLPPAVSRAKSLPKSTRWAQRRVDRAEILRAGAYRQRHLRDVRRGQRDARRRHLLERSLPVH